MTTGVKNGLNPYRKLGSQVDNQSIDEYPMADQYASNIFKGDPVKFSGQNIVLATDGDVDGVFAGVFYTQASGWPVHAPYWPASTDSGVTPQAKVDTDMERTYQIKAAGSVAQVAINDRFTLDNVGTGSTLTGQSAAVVRVGGTAVGTTSLTGVTDLDNVANIADNDAFTVRTTATGSATTITIANLDGPTELLTKLNAVSNISASLTSGGYLKIEATDGYDLVLLESTNTPLSALGINAGVHYAKSGASKATGTVDINGNNDLGASITGLVDNDAFTVRSTASGQAATAIVIADGDGDNELLNKLKAVAGIKAYCTSAGYLVIEATDGGDVVLANATNTPLADFGLIAGRHTTTAGMVKVRHVLDSTNNVLEVVLSESA